MGVILKFPDKPCVAQKLHLDKGLPTEEASKAPIFIKSIATTIPKSVLRWLVDAVWTLTLILWPLLRWIIAIDVTIQAIRMVFYWDDAEAYAGWNFILHLLTFAAITFFVANHKIKKD